MLGEARCDSHLGGGSEGAYSGSVGGGVMRCLVAAGSLYLAFG